MGGQYQPGRIFYIAIAGRFLVALFRGKCPFRFCPAKSGLVSLRRSRWQVIARKRIVMFGIGARIALIGLRRIMMSGVPSPGMGNSIHSAKVKPTKEPAQSYDFVLLKAGYIEVCKTRRGRSFNFGFCYGAQDLMGGYRASCFGYADLRD